MQDSYTGGGEREGGGERWGFKKWETVGRKRVQLTQQGQGQINVHFIFSSFFQVLKDNIYLALKKLIIIIST